MNTQHEICEIQLMQVLRGKFIALNAYIREEVRLQTSVLSFYLKELKKKKQTQSKQKK